MRFARATRTSWPTSPVLWTSAAVVGATAWYLWGRRRRHTFRDQVVLITGGSRGLGLELARRFVTEGARVIFCSRVPEEVARAQRVLSVGPGSATGMVCDVTHDNEVAALVREVFNRFGGIDVLINNAGVMQVGPLDSMTVGDFERAMAVHFWAPLNFMRRVVPAMRRAKGGRIVNIASIGGKLAVPHMAPYCASKFALVGLSTGVRSELRRAGISVTTVSPGPMRTGSARNATFKGDHHREFAWFSLIASAPGLSISSERAARQIIEACRGCRAELVITPAARLGAWARALTPNLWAGAIDRIERFLPHAANGRTRGYAGWESFSWISPSWLTVLNDEAARRNLELPVPASSSPL